MIHRAPAGEGGAGARRSRQCYGRSAAETCAAGRPAVDARRAGGHAPTAGAGLGDRDVLLLEEVGDLVGAARHLGLDGAVELTVGIITAADQRANLAVARIDDLRGACPGGRDEAGKLLEPFETLYIEAPGELRGEAYRDLVAAWTKAKEGKA